MKKADKTAKLDSAALAKHNALLDEKQATQALEVRHSAHLQKLGHEILVQVAKTGEKYLDLCKYIRENMVAPKLVSHELSQLGFHRNVISKINKVANASNDVWNEYAARLIGFNKVVEIGAASKVLAESTGGDVVDIAAQVEELEGAEEKTEAENPALVPPTADETKAKHEKNLISGASRALSAAAALQLKRQKTIEGGNGYVLIIKRSNKKPSVNETRAKVEEQVG